MFGIDPKTVGGELATIMFFIGCYEMQALMTPGPDTDARTEVVKKVEALLDDQSNPIHLPEFLTSADKVEEMAIGALVDLAESLLNKTPIASFLFELKGLSGPSQPSTP